MNVAFLSGNMGGILLSSKQRNDKSFNGKQETFSLLRLLALHNPNNNYLVYHKCGGYEKYIKSGEYEEDFPHKNVYFVANEVIKNKTYKKMDSEGKLTTECKEILDNIIKYTNELGGLDYGISFCTFSNQAIPGTIRKVRDPKYTTKLIQTSLNSLYSLYVSEYYKLPYIVYTVDMRFVEKKSRTYTNPPKVIFGFYTGEEILTLPKDFTYESAKSKQKINHKVKYIYDGADLLTLTSKESLIDNSKIDINKKKDFKIYANQHNAVKYDRLKVIREFTKDINIKIYGKFNENSEYYGNDIFNMLDRESMFKNMENLKYTLIVPNDFPHITPNYTSAKFWESIHMKVIPFMHNDYGSKEWRSYHNIPEFLFVSSNEELKEKINFLENNKEEYEKLIKELSNMLKEEFYNGKFINDNLNKCINEYILQEK